jgi:hypothetical protein
LTKWWTFREEREYYKAVDARVQLEFNKFLKAGSLNSVSTRIKEESDDVC